MGEKIDYKEDIKGMDVVKKIGAIETDSVDKPLEPVVINKVTIKR